MNRYILKVLYPTSNKYEVDQFKMVEILATECNMADVKGVYVFTEHINFVASYPVNYTIIEHIDYDVA